MRTKVAAAAATDTTAAMAMAASLRIVIEHSNAGKGSANGDGFACSSKLGECVHQSQLEREVKQIESCGESKGRCTNHGDTCREDRCLFNPGLVSPSERHTV